MSKQKRYFRCLPLGLKSPSKLQEVAIISAINHKCAFPALTCQNVLQQDLQTYRQTQNTPIHKYMFTHKSPEPKGRVQKSWIAGVWVETSPKTTGTLRESTCTFSPFEYFQILTLGIMDIELNNKCARHVFECGYRERTKESTEPSTVPQQHQCRSLAQHKCILFI